MPQKYLHRYLNISYVTTHLCLILVVFVRFLLLPRGIFVRVVHRLLVSVVNEVALVGVIVLFGSRFAGRGILNQIKQINQINQSIIFAYQSLPISISNWITIWLPEYPHQSVEVFRICIHYADRIHFMVHLENQIKRVISTGTGKQEKISNRFRINLSRKYLQISINLRTNISKILL